MTQKMAKQGLYVGYDLCDEKTQIYYLCEGMDQPKAVGGDGKNGDDREEEVIPTVLAEKTEKEEWLFGASAEAADSGCRIYRNFIRRLADPSDSLQQQPQTAKKLLVVFFRKTLRLLKQRFPKETITKMLVTTDYLTETLVSHIYAALRELGINRDRVSIVSQERCYLYYVAAFEGLEYNRDSVLFDYTKQGMFYHIMNTGKQNSSYLVRLESTDASSLLPYSESAADVSLRSAVFENMAGSLLYKRNVASAYITGCGFRQEGLEPVLKRLCQNGRVRIYAGQNLYAMGACFGAWDRGKDGPLSDNIFYDNEAVRYSIYVDGYQNAEQKQEFFVKAGTAWYDARKSIQVLLDGKRSVQMQVCDPTGKRTGSFQLPFTNLAKRPQRMTRIELRLFFTAPDTLVVQGKDLGFGAVYPSSRRIWEETVKL